MSFYVVFTQKSKMKAVAKCLLALAAILYGKPVISQMTMNLEKCERITIPICQNLEYNETQFPNSMGNYNMEEAAKQIHNSYALLIKVGCSPDIKLFLCTMFAPPCIILDNPLPPCYDLCESAKAGCEDIVEQFGYEWPPDFKCSKFPVAGDGALCVSRSNIMPGRNDLERVHTSTDIPRLPNSYDEMMDFVCPAQLKAPHDLDFKLTVGNVVAEDCGAPCYK